MDVFDHVVVGGGIVGASVAYHLRCKDAGTVLLLERNDLASAASSQAAGLILQASTKPSKTALARLTVNTIPALEEETGTSAGFHRVGSLRVAASDDRSAELDAMVQDASGHGIPVEWPGKIDIARMVPWLDVSSIHKAAFLPTDGYADPYLLTMAYLNAARARGATVRSRTNVRDVVVKHGAVAAVLTDAGRVACGSVVDCCGVWAALLSQHLGFALPMAPVRSHYWIAEADACFGGAHPVTVLPDAAAYTRPELGGLVLGVQEPRSASFDARDLPDDPARFSATRGEDHWDILVDAHDALSRFLPAIDRARFSGYISGLSSYTPDGNIILGPVPGVSGFHAAAGDCGSGITLSAGMGDLCADLVLGRTPAVDVTAFCPGRFGQVDPFSASFRERCAAARASKSRTAS